MDVKGAEGGRHGSELRKEKGREGRLGTEEDVLASKN